MLQISVQLNAPLPTSPPPPSTGNGEPKPGTILEGPAQHQKRECSQTIQVFTPKVLQWYRAVLTICTQWRGWENLNPLPKLRDVSIELISIDIYLGQSITSQVIFLTLSDIIHPFLFFSFFHIGTNSQIILPSSMEIHSQGIKGNKLLSIMMLQLLTTGFSIKKQRTIIGTPGLN